MGAASLKLDYTSPLFEQALIAAGVDQEKQALITEQVKLLGKLPGPSRGPGGDSACLCCFAGYHR